LIESTLPIVAGLGVTAEPINRGGESNAAGAAFSSMGEFRRHIEPSFRPTIATGGCNPMSDPCLSRPWEELDDRRKKKLIRDVESLRESIRLAGPEFVRGNVAERKQALKHIGWCLTELTAFRDRLTKTDWPVSSSHPDSDPSPL
jgi:hypothetical protein